jgi:hypothetical protein
MRNIALSRAACFYPPFYTHGGDTKLCPLRSTAASRKPRQDKAQQAIEGLPADADSRIGLQAQLG